MTRNKFTILFIKLCWIVYVVKGIHRKDILPYGPLSGDLTLQEGDDETSKVIVLTRPMHFYEASFPNLYVATNGIISTLDLPMEKQYVDDGFPTDFPVIAPFLADLDTSNGRGTIYYRQTESPNILNRVAMEVHRGFPDARFNPTHAVVVTWENVGAYEEGSRSIGPSNRVNTFQAVVAYDGTDTYALFLYPEDGLRFFGTRPKESYNVEIELPARVGFSRGEVSFLFFSRQEGPYYSITSNEQSVKNLYQVGNTGVPGVWLFHIGSSYSFENVIPASVGGVLATGPPFDAELEHATTPEYSEYSESDYPEFQSPTLPEFVEAGPDPSLLQSPGQPQVQLYGEDVPFTSSPEIPETPNSESGPREYPAVPEPRNRPPEDSGLPQRPVPEHTILEVYPNRQGESPRYTPNSQVDSELEGVDIDTGVIQYNAGSKDTCERFGQQCSQSAYCSDYATGFCCHCRSSFYGNGRHCLPNGAPHRVNGKVNGVVLVGSTPVELNNIDMHAYVVVGDGRAYTAVSEVPEPAGWALMPVAPIGGLFGWLFALELPNSQNGFTITGAEFTRHADITFYPGNQRLYIVQTGKGLDTENYLSVDTQLRGSVPFIPPGSTVQMEPFKVTFQYYPSVATSTSVREFTVVSAESGAETFSFQLRQNITYQDCRHGPRSGPETQELSVERVFAMYVKEERILRYAITNKIGPVGAGNPDPGEVNPCYAGTHDCDTTAQCIPGEGQLYQCQCATGYRGDGRNCYDIDECAERLSSCGAHAQCENLQGSHRCLCQPGYEFGFDGRTCIDVDECRSQPCHAQAICSNALGSFRCQCQSGFHGNGFQCYPQNGGPDRPKTQCEHHRDSVQGSQDGFSLVGAFIPECDEEGQYRPLQCHGSTGHCWCVSDQGQERAGTRTPAGSPRPNCDEQVQPERPKTQCQHHRDSLQGGVGAFVPECDEEGRYRQLQCHGSTGHCWCVSDQGQERAGTRTPAGSPRPNCDEQVQPERPKTQCQHHRDSLQGSQGGVGAFVPQCDEEGQYRPLQCHGSTGQCWCVSDQGQERAGTRTPAGTPPINCDGPVVVPPTQRPETVCERWRASLIEHYGGQPDSRQYLPQCDWAGEFNPVQCYGDSSYCWCVDKDGREVPGTRSNDAVKPGCIPTVAPPTMRPLPRPDVTPPPVGVSLLYAQGQQIGALPLTGTRMDKDKSSVLLQLHGSIVVGVAHDCQEGKVYWTDIAGRTINRASLVAGSEPEVLINTDLTSPEGLALDVVRRKMFWVDSTMDKIETSNLDGTGRRVLFDKDLVNPRAIIVDSSSGTLYWTDWNREAPKLESASVDGQNRKVLVQEGIGLPNAITFNPISRQVCWADAGTKRLECISPDGTGRQVIHSGLSYPFAMVFHANHFYFTDWRRDAIISMSKGTSQFTDDYLPEQRSHLYGIAVASPSCL
ncbi:nidogen-2 isoform X4 [Clupea harengus]|uniref:Nidogen-2 isoform X4 n=1 Tax=Clupea harengus TaxID=7950 RepID=A0A6P8G8P4_CLUHA|nr:nidogen-2 isoform X4 [Clupea harengus]